MSTHPLFDYVSRTPAGRSKTRFAVKSAAEAGARARLDALLAKFPVYPQLDLAVLQKHFG